MTTVFRHGGEAHVVRPDRVYRTSVLSPIVGYNPTADVQAVARAFTQGPPSGTVLSGLGATANFGPLRRLGLRIKAAWAARGARKFMAVAATDNQMAGPPPGPGPMTPGVMAPGNGQQMAMVRQITNRGNAGAYGAFVVANGRLDTYYKAR
jgi:hypothetical protein